MTIDVGTIVLNFVKKTSRLLVEAGLVPVVQTVSQFLPFAFGSLLAFSHNAPIRANRDPPFVCLCGLHRSMLGLVLMFGTSLEELLFLGGKRPLL